MPRGGARFGPTVGGIRRGAGRPRQRLTLDKAAAKELHLLTKIQRQFAPATTEEMVVTNLIHDALDETTDDYQQRADQSA